MMSVLQFNQRICLLAAVVAIISGLPDSMDYDYPETNPVFISQSETFNVKEGETITMPCEIQDLGPYPVIWRQGKIIISAGPTITAIDRRFQLVQGHDLRLQRVRAKDAGSFTCSLSTDPVMELTHTVDVLYGPKVSTVPDTGVLVAESGNDVDLKCLAEGKPSPQLFWKRQADALPGGEDSFAGPTYRIAHVSRQMAGVYECVADNGVGPIAIARVSLQVHYAPEIEVERSTVYTGEGRQTQLICYVYSDPPAEVVWTREGTDMDHVRHVRTDEQQMGPRHVLTIGHVRQDDFDTYTCQASNSLGTANGRMVLTGVADRVRVTSPPIGGAPDTYDLAWEVQSFSDVIEYKVAYRRAKFNASVDKPSQWKEVIVPNPGGQAEEDLKQTQRITLRNLHPATLYDLYIQARNKHGWNAVSDMFHFSTISRGAALESRVADNSTMAHKPLHPLLGALFVIIFFIIPVII